MVPETKPARSDVVPGMARVRLSVAHAMVKARRGVVLATARRTCNAAPVMAKAFVADLVTEKAVHPVVPVTAKVLLHMGPAMAKAAHPAVRVMAKAAATWKAMASFST